MRCVWKTNPKRRLRFRPVNEEKSLVYLIFFESLFFLFVFCIFVFSLNPLVKSTLSWKTTPFCCRSRKNFLARKNSFNFLARKMIVSFFWLESKAFAVLPIFWGNLKGQNRWPGQIYSQKDESFLRPLRKTFTRCLTLIPSDKFWRNFLHFDTKELWTQNNRFPRVVQNSRELLLSTD